MRDDREVEESSYPFAVGPLGRDRVWAWNTMLLTTSLRVRLRRNKDGLRMMSEQIKAQLENLEPERLEIVLQLKSDGAYRVSTVALCREIQFGHLEGEVLARAKDFLLTCEQAQHKADPSAIHLAMKMTSQAGPEHRLTAQLRDFLKLPPWERK